ncbi:glucosaminidase domain-containing protein [Flavobacterium psychrophilum]|nr:glucosaminidase domain-containing protein [Flavobacterium psychrophilum]EKT4516694.1 glucosaminidase domain-containing protein [Flavobacterium psychrophilum]ELM3649592.1 glucosaminidase domain-containing protein [Flavobacterium psychrophilum]ELM3670360.1 glucosaminidase domain-containing protein [Flavobacterium psychrophilum]ELM3725316.1 glucosaminidase domain-containing protein [Flavobacterium psychrophilum]
MTKGEFVKSFYPNAKRTQDKTGIPALAILAQAAVESGWGKVCPGNMLFGVKDTDGINGNEQLLITTEYSKSANAKFANIISVKPVLRNGSKWFKYTLKDYFRKYETPEECFTDHANFFIKNKRYAKALTVKNNPYQFIDAIAKAGYATDPNYAKLLKEIAINLEKLI